jgi:hypothetical protein
MDEAPPTLQQMATDSSFLREPYPVPSHADRGATLPTNNVNIAFRHPGYDDSCNILLVMPALDRGGGIHHDTAKIACGILAGNRWDGYFTEDKAGQIVVLDETLLKGDYYFHLPNTTGA